MNMDFEERAYKLNTGVHSFGVFRGHGRDGDLIFCSFVGCGGTKSGNNIWHHVASLDVKQPLGHVKPIMVSKILQGLMLREVEGKYDFSLPGNQRKIISI